MAFPRPEPGQGCNDSSLAGFEWYKVVVKVRGVEGVRCSEVASRWVEGAKGGRSLAN